VAQAPVLVGMVVVTMGWLQQAFSGLNVSDWATSQLHDGGTVAIIILFIAALLWLIFEAMKKVLVDVVAKNLTTWRLGMATFYGIPILACFLTPNVRKWTGLLMLLCGGAVWWLHSTKHRSLLMPSFVFAQLIVFFAAYKVESQQIAKQIAIDRHKMHVYVVLAFEDTSAGSLGSALQTDISQGLRTDIDEVLSPNATIRVKPTSFASGPIDDWNLKSGRDKIISRLKMPEFFPDIVLKNCAAKTGDRDLTMDTSFYTFDGTDLSPINKHFGASGAPADAHYLELKTSFGVYRQIKQDLALSLSAEQETLINRKILAIFREFLSTHGKQFTTLRDAVDRLSSAKAIRDDEISALLDRYHNPRQKTRSSSEVQAKIEANIAKFTVYQQPTTPAQ
jgi:hypothetical protein